MHSSSHAFYSRVYVTSIVCPLGSKLGEAIQKCSCCSLFCMFCCVDNNVNQYSRNDDSEFLSAKCVPPQTPPLSPEEDHSQEISLTFQDSIVQLVLSTEKRRPFTIILTAIYL